MTHRDQPSLDTSDGRGLGDGAADNDAGLAAFAGEHLAVMPGQTSGVDENLRNGLLDRPSAGKGHHLLAVSTRCLNLPIREDARDKAGRAIDDRGEATDVDQVDADADDSGRQFREQDYSTVTDLARLRG